MKDFSKQFVLIGAKFKQLRQSKGYTQGQVADVLGVSSQHYGTLERGINAYSLDNILKLCDFYNISVMSVLGEIRKSDRKRKKECEKLITQIEELGDEHKEVVSHMVKFYRQLEKKIEKEEERAVRERQLEGLGEKKKTLPKLKDGAKEKLPVAETVLRASTQETPKKTAEKLEKKTNKKNIQTVSTKNEEKHTSKISEKNNKKH